AYRFVSTEAAHSTAAFQPVKRVSKIFFSIQPLVLQRTTYTTEAREVNLTATQIAVNPLRSAPPTEAGSADKAAALLLPPPNLKITP
ncbi:hypothetical protein ACFPTX_10375, partial [Pseudomonas sp. GCM10022188]|nr:hypothetical protein [Pseudomonas oryzagri]